DRVDLLLDRHDPARPLRLPGAPAALRRLSVAPELPVTRTRGRVSGRQEERPDWFLAFRRAVRRLVVRTQVEPDADLFRLAHRPADEPPFTQPPQQPADPETFGAQERQ